MYCHSKLATASKDDANITINPLNEEWEAAYMTFEEIVRLKEIRAREEALAEGRKEGQQELLINQLEKGLITLEQAIECGYSQPQT